MLTSEASGAYPGRISETCLCVKHGRMCNGIINISLLRLINGVNTCTARPWLLYNSDVCLPQVLHGMLACEHALSANPLHALLAAVLLSSNFICNDFMNVAESHEFVLILKRIFVENQ
ncbi:hypothetical protein J6590_062304 [Homalodisca vitripennis]|nr:hypothetical protein J6590_062304 [Homalodisca vitripennis]